MATLRKIRTVRRKTSFTRRQAAAAVKAVMAERLAREAAVAGGKRASKSATK